MTFFIRTAETGDADSIAELSVTLGYLTGENAVQNRLGSLLDSDDHCVFVAVNYGQIIGWIHAFSTLRITSDSFVEIGGLLVGEDHQRKGFGEALVDRISQWTKEKGIENLRVRSNTMREGSHEFYEKLGFEEVKEQKIFVSRI